MSPLTVEQQGQVESHMRLVASIARELRPWRMHEDDVMQAGVMGLIRAIQGFDPAFGCELSTIAYPHIKSAILRAEQRDVTIYVPLRDKRYASETYSARKLRARRTVSLSAFASDPTVAPAPSEPGVEPERVRDAMRFLPSREREIVEATVLRGELLKDAAARLGVTKQAVHAARTKALEKLRRSLSQYAEAS